jgi:glyoxylase-like metal-dependent hydrolase (beta-lactamase superfamily II)
MIFSKVLPLLDEGLGNQAYLVDLGEGRALAVDPALDVRLLDATAGARGPSVAFGAETHLHADFLSGATRKWHRDGARVIASQDGGRRFDHVRLEDGGEVDLAGLMLRSWSPPGHTDEHIAYLLSDGDQSVAVFTGGSLNVGAAAGTDPMRPERTDALARAHFRSLRRLAELPDETLGFPTHGAGSFCSAPPGAERTSTIGREGATNLLMRLDDEDAFVAALLASLRTYPPYFARLAEMNRQGPDDAGPAGQAQLSPAEAAALRRAGHMWSTSARPPTTPPGNVPARWPSSRGQGPRRGWSTRPVSSPTGWSTSGSAPSSRQGTCHARATSSSARSVRPPGPRGRWW